MISIIIIVKNDPRIEALLAKLATIKSPEQKEIIVVDASKGSLDEIRLKYPYVTWLDFPPLLHKKTYAEQRNMGIKSAKGDIIVFIDADCIPDTDWLAHLISPIQKKGELIVSGACRPFGKSFIHKEEQYGKYREECETMNIAIAKEVFEKVGYFDEHLEGCEDSDFCIRARRKGYKIRHTKDAIIYHDWGGIMKNVTRSYYGGRDRIRLYTKHINHLGVLNSNNIYTAYYVLYLVFLPLAFLFPWYVLILFIPSLVKRRNPIKELFNLVFAVGVLVQLFTIITKREEKKI